MDPVTQVMTICSDVCMLDIAITMGVKVINKMSIFFKRLIELIGFLFLPSTRFHLFWDRFISFLRSLLVDINTVSIIILNFVTYR
jgi:hypothetical protein